MLDGFALKHEDCRRAALLFHGLTGAPGEMYRYGRALYKGGYDVYCPVLPGHCRGVEAIKGTKWSDWHLFALKSFDDLARTYPEVYVSGICLGAVMAVAVAFERKSVAAVSALSTTLFLDGWGLPRLMFLLPIALSTVFRYLYAFPEGGALGVKDPAVRAAIRRHMAKKGAGPLDCFPLIAVHELLKISRFVRKNLRQVTAPILIVHAEEDDLTSMRSADVLYQGVGSREKRLMSLKDSYHLITMDRERDIVFQETLRFFGSVSGHDQTR